MSKPVDVDETTFDKVVLQSDAPVFVDFWAPHCQPCVQMEPFLEELAEAYRDRVSFVKVNVDDNPQLQRRYSVMGLPTILIFKGGKPSSHIVGFKSRTELRDKLEEAVD